MLKILRLITTASQPKASFQVSEHVIRRWAGHSKWANIKHQKSANDVERNKIFTRLSRMIRVAIVEGKDPNPETNCKLQSVIGQCKRFNMPASSINNSIKAAISSKGEEKTAMLQIRGPGRCALLVEIATPNIAHFKNQVASMMKKHGCKYDNVNRDFLEKGFLTAMPIAGSKNPVDDATEHAIEASVEEVSFDEQAGKLRFECSPEATWKSKKILEEKGYVIESAIVEFLPNNVSELADDELELVSKFVEKLEAMPEVMKVTDNIA